MNLKNDMQAQCTFSTCGTPFPITSVTINTPTTYNPVTTSGGCVQVSGTITINSTLTIDAVDMQMASTASIVVNGGGLLIIKNATEIYASGNMWAGITVNGGGRMDMTDSEIYHAYTGITGNNSGGFESEIDISGSCFTNNEIGIQFGYNSLPAASNSLIEGTEFTAPNLIAPLSGEVGDYGILVTLQDEEGFGIQIGNGSSYTPSTANYFHELGIAIRAHRSNITVQNCNFEDINPSIGTLDLPTTGTFIETTNGYIGVCATSIFVPNIYCILQVGLTTTTGDNNQMNNISYGIYAENYVNTELHKNRILSATASSYILRNAIEIKGTSTLHNIKGNFIQNFNLHGIKMTNTQLGSINIEENEILTSTSGGIGDYGIRLNDVANPLLLVSGINIDHVQTDIFANGYDDAEITLNEVDFFNSDFTILTSYGVHLLNSVNADITMNDITGNCTGVSTCTNNVRCVYLKNCPEFLADKNNVEKASAGIWCEDDVDDGNITCNEIRDCYWGVLLYDIGGTPLLAPIGNIETGTGGVSDNGWYPELTANRVRTQAGSLVEACNWYYRNDFNYFNMLGAGYLSAGGGTSLPAIIETEGEYCDQPLRLAALTLEDSLIELENKYNIWAEVFISEDLYENTTAYYQAMTFWNDINDSENVIELLSGDLLTAYNKILNSNIPAFDSLSAYSIIDDKDMFTAKNNAIIPVNEIEETLQTVNAIHLNSWDDVSGVFKISEEDKITLNEIINLNGYVYGSGVLRAWAILDTVLHTLIADEEKLATDQHIVSSVYPNPASDYFSINTVNNPNRIYDIRVSDVFGKVIKKYKNINSDMPLDISTLASGYYNVQVLENGVFQIKIPLIILKPNK